MHGICYRTQVLETNRYDRPAGGGDEFAILFSEADSDTAQAATDRFNKYLLDAMRQNRWPITFSIGLVTCLKAAASVEELMKKADELMYQVKMSGKNDIPHAVVC